MDEVCKPYGLQFGNRWRRVKNEELGANFKNLLRATIGGQIKKIIRRTTMNKILTVSCGLSLGLIVPC